MSEVYATLEEATAALASTAERAAILIRTESARAKDEAGRTRREIDDLRSEVRAAKAEFECVRTALASQVDDRERIRRSAGWAWSAVGVMGACVMIAIGWTATQVTRGRAAVASLNSSVAELHRSLENRETELSAVRTQLETARIAQARAEMEVRLLAGELARAPLPELPETVSVQPGPDPVTSIDPEWVEFDPQAP